MSVNIFSSKQKSSGPNRRLFFGNVPMNKTRDDVWKALLREGVANIVDVISYKSYSDRHVNRGYVFVEFTSPREAEKARAKYRNNLKLFGKKVIIDWSNVMVDPEPNEMKSVKKIFIRNLPVTMARHEFVEILTDALPDLHSVVKVYKFKDYSFVHFDNRKNAEKALEILKNYFQSDIQVTWAKPPGTFRTSNSLNPSKISTEQYNTKSKHKCFCHLKSAVDSPPPSSSSTTLNTIRRFSTSSCNSPLSTISCASSSSGVDFSYDSSGDVTSPNNVSKNCSIAMKEQVSFTEQYPLLQNEPEWVLDFLVNTLKVALKGKTLKELIDELDIDFFDDIS